jgi:hypothetical protein
MRARLLGLAIVAVCLPAFAVPSIGQVPPPTPRLEHKRLSAWLGTWTCENKEGIGGTMTCDWAAGGFFLECPGGWKTASGTLLEVRTVMGYSEAEKGYTWYQYWSNGWSAYSRGSIQANTWTWVFETERGPEGLRRRQVASRLSEDGWTYKWEWSVEGEPWRVSTEGNCTKLK